MLKLSPANSEDSLSFEEENSESSFIFFESGEWKEFMAQFPQQNGNGSSYPVNYQQYPQGGNSNPYIPSYLQGIHHGPSPGVQALGGQPQQRYSVPNAPQQIYGSSGMPNTPQNQPQNRPPPPSYEEVLYLRNPQAHFPQMPNVPSTQPQYIPQPVFPGQPYNPNVNNQFNQPQPQHHNHNPPTLPPNRPSSQNLPPFNPNAKKPLPVVPMAVPPQQDNNGDIRQSHHMHQQHSKPLPPSPIVKNPTPPPAFVSNLFPDWASQTSTAGKQENPKPVESTKPGNDNVSSSNNVIKVQKHPAPQYPLPPRPEDSSQPSSRPQLKRQKAKQELADLPPTATKTDSEGNPVVMLTLPRKKSESRTRTRPSGLVETIRRLPPELRTDIHHFEMENYAKHYFKQQKRGFLRRAIPMEALLEWSKELNGSLLNTLKERHQKEALEIFKHIQEYMGDRPKPRRGRVGAALFIVSKGVSIPELRDEVYCQIIKQVTMNPSVPSTIKGWELMAIVIDSFPCTKNLEPYIRSYLHECSLHLTESRVSVYAAYCLRRYDARWKYSTDLRIPSREEIKQIRKDPFQGAMFGGSLEEIMQEQRKEHPNVRIPRVMAILCDCILDSGGEKTEGIFRISANHDRVFEMKVILEKGTSTLRAQDDAHVPACLLKTWFLELKDPLIPTDFYQKFLDNAENMDELSELVYNELPDVNRNTLLFLIRFLRIIATPENQKHTKMSLHNMALIFSPNIFRCTSLDPMTMLQNTKIESKVLDSLFEKLKLPDSIPGVYGVRGGH